LNRPDSTRTGAVTGGLLFEYFRRVNIIGRYADTACTRNIEMAPLCKVEVTLAWVLGSREVRHDGGVDEQARVQPA
jgi:hypothetical protein